MKNIITLIIFCVLAFSCSQDASINKKKAKPAPEWVTNGIDIRCSTSYV